MSTMENHQIEILVLEINIMKIIVSEKILERVLVVVRMKVDLKGMKNLKEILKEMMMKEHRNLEVHGTKKLISMLTKINFRITNVEVAMKEVEVVLTIVEVVDSIGEMGLIKIGEVLIKTAVLMLKNLLDLITINLRIRR